MKKALFWGTTVFCAFALVSCGNAKPAPKKNPSKYKNTRSVVSQVEEVSQTSVSQE